MVQPERRFVRDLVVANAEEFLDKHLGDEGSPEMKEATSLIGDLVSVLRETPPRNR